MRSNETLARWENQAVRTGRCEIGVIFSRRPHKPYLPWEPAHERPAAFTLSGMAENLRKLITVELAVEPDTCEFFPFSAGHDFLQSFRTGSSLSMSNSLPLNILNFTAETATAVIWAISA